MSRRSRQREAVWQAKHYQPEPDMEWPLPPEQKIDFETKEQKKDYDNEQSMQSNRCRD